MDVLLLKAITDNNISKAIQFIKDGQRIKIDPYLESDIVVRIYIIASGYKLLHIRYIKLYKFLIRVYK